MKRFAMLSILLLAGCQGGTLTSPDPQVNTAALKRSADCGLVFIPSVEATGQHKGARWIWNVTGKFFTTPCASDLRVKVWFVYPDGRQKPIGAADAPVVRVSPNGDIHEFDMRWIVPKEWETFPEPWYPEFLVDVRSGGQSIGTFTVYEH
jgi:hypothetical protein